MPWKEVSSMGLRREFVTLASQDGANVARLCRRFEISRKTGYKWLTRYREQGAAGLGDRSRRPQASPRRTANTIEELVVQARQQHPAWGGRKLRAFLERRSHGHLPSVSTITEILRRHGLLSLEESVKHRPLQRFEHARPNDLWQMDFKGHFGLENGTRCHPLTVLDDHSRFSVCLEACGDERTKTVQERLTVAFRRYGLPGRLLADNGSPWGGGDCREHPYTPLTVWLLRLDVSVSHGRPYHPQTQGKEERFHRTLNLELLSRRSFRDLAECQRQFAPWREEYNLHRPHQALGMQVPADRYQPSSRAFPERLPAIEYADARYVRHVNRGHVSVERRRVSVGKAFDGYPLALESTPTDGVLAVRFAHQVLGTVNLRDEEPRLQRTRGEYTAEGST
jgi:transposase InsO family protein